MLPKRRNNFNKTVLKELLSNLYNQKLLTAFPSFVEFLTNPTQTTVILSGRASDGSVSNFTFDKGSGILFIQFAGTDSTQDIQKDLSLGHSSKYGAQNQSAHIGFGKHVEDYTYNAAAGISPTNKIKLTLDKTSPAFPLTLDGETWYLPGFLLYFSSVLNDEYISEHGLVNIYSSAICLIGHSLGAGVCQVIAAHYNDYIVMRDIMTIFDGMFGANKATWVPMYSWLMGMPSAFDGAVNIGKNVNMTICAKIGVGRLRTQIPLDLCSDPIESQRVSGSWRLPLNFRAQIPSTTSGVIGFMGSVTVNALALVLNKTVVAAEEGINKLVQSLHLHKSIAVKKAVDASVFILGGKGIGNLLLHRYVNYKAAFKYNSTDKHIEMLLNTTSTDVIRTLMDTPPIPGPRRPKYIVSSKLLNVIESHKLVLSRVKLVMSKNVQRRVCKHSVRVVAIK